MEVPKNLGKVLDEGDGMGKTIVWSPILLTAMSDTEFNGRAIPIAGQIDVRSFRRCVRRGSARLEKAGRSPTDTAGAITFKKVLRKLTRACQAFAFD